MDLRLRGPSGRSLRSRLRILDGRHGHASVRLRGEHKEFTTLLHDGADSCLKVQGVASGPGGAHLDFPVADVGEFTRSALRLGAEVVDDHGSWAVLRSPAGQLFCTMPWGGEATRPPVVHGSRLDQVCVDLAPSLYDAEVAFLTGPLPE